MRLQLQLHSPAQQLVSRADVAIPIPIMDPGMVSRRLREKKAPKRPVLILDPDFGLIVLGVHSHIIN